MASLTKWGGVATEESAPAQTVAESEVEENTVAQEAEATPESNGTPDVVLEETPSSEEGDPSEEQSASEEGDPSEEQSAPEEGDPSEEQVAPEEGDPSEEQVAPEEGDPSEEQVAPEEGDSSEEQPAPDVSDTETDEGLEEEGDPSVDGVSDEYGIMPAIIDPPLLDDDGDPIYGSTCPHNLHDPVPYEGEVKTIVDISYSGHTYATQKVTGMQCPDCGYFFEYNLGDPVKGTEEPHEFSRYGNYCPECHYECPHLAEDVTLESETTDTLYEWKDNESHYVYEGTVQNYKCNHCGDTWSVNSPCDETNAKIEPHRADEYWESSYCEDCGHEFLSKDAGAEHVHHWELEYTSSRYETYTAQGDQCVGRGLIVTGSYRCTAPDCPDGEIYGVQVAYDPDATRIESHAFEGGYCEKCHAKAAISDCDHKNAAANYYSEEIDDEGDVIIGETYRSTGHGSHEITVRRRVPYYCPDCNLSFDKIDVSTYLEPCWIEEYEDPTHCAECGALLIEETDCTHEGTLVEIERNEYPYNPTVVYNGDHTHTITCAKSWVEIAYACSKCGKIVEKREEIAGETVRTEDCYYGEDGYCDECLSKNDCEHQMSEWYDSSGSYYRSVSPEMHEVILKGKKYRYCTKDGCNFDEYYTDSAPAKVEGTEAHRWDNNGKCEDCGFVNTCTHSSGKTYTELSRDVYDGQLYVGTYGTIDWEHCDDFNHMATYAQYELTFCADCGQRLSAKFKGVVTEKEPHAWENGDYEGMLICTVCGRTKYIEAGTCKHPNAAQGRVVSTSNRYEQIAGDAKNHNVVTTTTYRCPDCLQNVAVTAKAVKGEHHYGNDNVCDDCEFTCNHAHKAEKPDSSTPKENPKIEQIPDNDRQHKESAVTVNVWNECPDCKQKVTEEKLDTKNVDHTYPEDGTGVCSVCGYKCSHSGAVKGVPQVSAPAFKEANQTTHTYTVTTTVETGVCPTCGFKGGDDVTTKDTTTAHTWENGVCSVCKYTCIHTFAPEVDATVWSGEYDETKATEDTHTEIGTKTTTKTCTNCGLVEEVKTETVYNTAEAHNWVDGVCSLCGFACLHTEAGYGTTVKLDQFVVESVKSDDAKGHTLKGRTEDQTFCDHCGAMLNAVVTETEVTVFEKHSMAKGVCTVCGYKKPSEKKPAEEQEAVKDEPVFEEVASGAQMHGVTVGSGEGMATALVKAVQGIQSQYGSGVSIRFKDADEILAGVEYDALNRLPVQEQILVMLKVLGYEDEVNSAMSEMGITLSTDAETLAEVILERTTAMNAEELAAFEAAMKEYFPVTILATGDHIEITLEIRENAQSGCRLERYGFDFKDGKWQFATLSVAETN